MAANQLRIVGCRYDRRPYVGNLLKLAGDEFYIEPWSKLTNIVDYVRIPASSSTLTMVQDLTTLIRPGMPIRYTRSGSSTYYYGKVKTLTSGLMTIQGPPMPTTPNYLTGLWFSLSRYTWLPLTVAQAWDAGTSTTLLQTYTYYPVRWMGPRAHLVYFEAASGIADTGATQPKLNVRINTDRVSTNDGNLGIQLGTAFTWVANGNVAINHAHYTIDEAGTLELECSAAGTNGNAQYLQVNCYLVFD